MLTRFSHHESVWQRFPNLVPGLFVVNNLHDSVDLGERLEPFFAQARKRLAQSNESEFPQVAAWRRAYSQMGFKPTQYRSAPEALLRRFRREDNLPHLHPLVNLCNAHSLAWGLPVAVLDLAGVDSWIEVRPAVGNEPHLAFSGEFEYPEPDEIIFADASAHAHARRWTFRQSKQSTVQPTSRDVLVICEGLHEQAAQDVRDLMRSLHQQISELWSAPSELTILSAEQPIWQPTDQLFARTSSN
jgi:DNA/RNA-binding domain of Phe-tRNA-synthetase-like protein